MEQARRITPLLCLLLFFFEGFAQPAFTDHYPDTIIKKRLNTVIATEVSTYAAGLSFLSYYWYRDHQRVPFHFYNDVKGYLQMDKAGHAYSAYHESYSAYYALRWAGVDKRRALIFGAPIGFLFEAPIEIFDGLYEGWGFSWWDILANTTGMALFTTQEIFWEEQIVMMKFSYSPSGYPKYHEILGETPIENFIFDYNGHTYWLSGNLKRLTGIEKLPAWLNVAIGYSGNGMIKEFSNPDFYQGEPFPYLERYRQWMFSLDIDLSRIPSKKKWVKRMFKHLNMIKVPFPALEINRVDGLKFRPIYF
jgi:hypothetical protein